MIDALMDREGGYVSHSSDKGGPTCFGITEAVARAHGYAGPMRQLPRSEAAAIYRRHYWARPRFDKVAERSARVAAELFDTGVNMGPAVAATFLQRALTALNRNGRDYGNYILEKAAAMCESHEGQAGELTDVVITPAMLDAGMGALAASGLVDDLLEADRQVVAQIYRAMRRRSPD
jgi:lysozyme family protein